MSDAFLSQSWYRVAKLRPVLPLHAVVHRHRYLGGSWYVIEDKITGKSHKLSPTAYAFVGRLDGTRSVDSIWLEIAEQLEEHAPTQDDVIGLLSQLHGADLLRADIPADVIEMTERRRKLSHALPKQNLLNPMAIRVPVFDPDRLLARLLPFVRWAIGPAGFVAWLALIAVAAVVAGENWRALTENLSDRVFSQSNLLQLALVYPIVKAAHELGHGLVVKRYGGAVHEFGLMFLIFFPVPYVDASASAAFRSKWQRAAVGGAGIIVETALASLALFGWLALEPGFLRAVCFNVMLIGGVSTVFVNGNPLLRFDGYYVLADLIEMPNMGPRANKYIGHLVETKAFGLNDPRPFPARLAEKIVFLLYGPASYLYRLALSASIAIFVAQQYFVAGALLAAWIVFQSVLLPIGKALKQVISSGRLRPKRSRALAVTFGGFALVLGLLFLVPLPAWTSAEGVVWLPETAYVRAGTGGFLKTFDAQAGGAVAVGDRLARLDDPELDARMASLAWKVRQLEMKLAANQVTDQVLAQTTRIELQDAREQLGRVQEQARRMEVRSDAAGRFTPAVPEADAPGRFFKEGDLLGYVLPATADTVRVAVQQDSIERVRDSLADVDIVPSWRNGEEIVSRVVRAVPAGQFELPSAALSRAAGGVIATDPRDAKNRTALARVFQFDLALPPEPAPFGARVYVKFHHALEPAGLQLYRYARQLFLAKFDV